MLLSDKECYLLSQAPPSGKRLSQLLKYHELMIMIKVGWSCDDDDFDNNNDNDDDDDDEDDDGTHLWERLVLRGEGFTQSRLASQTNFNKTQQWE